MDEYRLALREHLQRPGEQNLARAYEMGRKALIEQLGTPELASAYREEVAAALACVTSARQAAAVAEAGAHFFSESLAPFEMTYRSFHQTYEALQASEERYRELFENASDIIFTLDLTGNFTSWNRRTEEVTGYRFSEDSPLNILQILAPGYAELAQELLDPKPGSRAPAEVEIFARDGRQLTVEVSTRLIYEDGKPAGVQGIARDLTEQKRAERKFQDLLDAAPDAMVVTNDEGTISYVNSEVQSLFGYQPKELLGKAVEILIPARFRESHPAHRAQFVATPRRRTMGERMELYGLRKDGSEFPISVSLGPLDTENGMLVISAIRDISDRKKAQEALQRMNRTLEEEAGRIAHALHDESGQLLASVHIAIAAMADGAPARIKKRVEEVKTLLEEIEDNLRQFSHELRPTVLDDLGLARALEVLARGVATRSGIDVNVECNIQRRPASSVETAIYRLVQEALTNVTRHAKASRAVVSIEERDGAIEGRVSDDGVGLDTKALSEPGKTGLGLIGMQARMSSIGGELTLSSQPGQGTEIRFKIKDVDSHVN